MKFIDNARVIRNHKIRQDIHSMWLESPLICQNSSPGQFVHLRVNNSFSPLLRRPLSIGRVHGNELELVWRIVGKGTEILAEAKEGESVDLLGPLGKPYSISEHLETAILVAGGLGLPPLTYLYEKLIAAGVKTQLLLGVLNENSIPLSDKDPLFGSILITSEEGELFRRGLVTEPVIDSLQNLENNGGIGKTSLYSCGPWGLIKALKKIVPHMKLLSAEVSLEQQMGCGIGICQGCAVPTEDDNDPFQLVCKDGPVFPLNEVRIPDAS
ncbi:MAG: dihydroorotate dehydrogenase electron transfer subunit [Candidatus Electryonea clarkiae]|nr:dihydroorotate dehydrogenase electron transfer subunit [Candidatus Electryonea clarkiae]MDP8288089.1 dihydroorotate dehydrogenase electron transfer subunit [Candidatus Electryonea clarkiae]